MDCTMDCNKWKLVVFFPKTGIDLSPQVNRNCGANLM